MFCSKCLCSDREVCMQESAMAGREGMGPLGSGPVELIKSAETCTSFAAG